jgi:hypothetical protein
MDIFGRKAKAATRRAEYLSELPKRIAEDPNRAYRWIEWLLTFVTQNDTPDFAGPRYTEIWHFIVKELQTHLAIAERAARIERIVKTQDTIAGIEEMREQMINATYRPMAHWDIVTPERLKKCSDELVQLRERLMAEKYGPLTWVPENPHRSPHWKPLTPRQIAVAVQELDRR